MSRPLLLLVDDCRDMALIVASLARRAGWEAAACGDATAAREALTRRRPDLVLLDVNLPGVRGPEWLRGVRRAPEFASLPVALYTNWGFPADVADGLEAGADAVFDKDLASRPADWQSRLAEIHELAQNGRAESWPAGDSWATMRATTQPLPSPHALAGAVRRAFLHPSLRRVAGELVPVLLRRALTRGFAADALPREIAAFMGPDGLDASQLPPTLNPAPFVRVAACVADEVRRLLGAESGRAFLDALAEALPAGEE